MKVNYFCVHFPGIEEAKIGDLSQLMLRQVSINFTLAHREQQLKNFAQKFVNTPHLPSFLVISKKGVKREVSK